jgi:Uma2 family endonuclease
MCAGCTTSQPRTAITPPKQAAPAQLPTLADLDALPPGIVGEIIEGVLYTMTKPRMTHQLIGLEIASDLLGPFGKGREGPGGWWIVTGPEIERPDNTLEISPDVGGWCRERMPKAPRKRAIGVVPDWVCEILSPTTRHHDLVDKMDAEERAALEAHLAAAWKSVQAGNVRPTEELLSELRARR